MMGYKIWRTACALLLLVTLTAGCATRYIEFKSDPSGATVRVDDLQCTTPCTLAVDDDATGAVLVSGVQEIPVNLPPSKKTRNFSYQFFDTTEKTLASLSAGLLLIGILGCSIIDDSIDEDEEVSRDLVWLTAGSFVAAGLFGLGMLGAKTVKERSQSEVWVTFAPEELPTRSLESPPPTRVLPDNLGLREEDMQRLFPVQDGLVPHAP